MDIPTFLGTSQSSSQRHIKAPWSSIFWVNLGGSTDYSGHWRRARLWKRAGEWIIVEDSINRQHSIWNISSTNSFSWLYLATIGKYGANPGGVLGSIFAGYVPLASQNPYPIIVYSVTNYRPRNASQLLNIKTTAGTIFNCKSSYF